jgi:ribose 5-phosphate isomerase A
MKREGGSEEAKRRAGKAAAETVSDGAVVGLGTGSTAAHAIRVLGRAVEDGADLRGVPTSFEARQLAVEAGMPLVDLDEVAGVDVAVDGADQVVGEGAALLKGGGAAHAREKVVDAAADRLLIVADPTKRADALDLPVPVECLPDARPPVLERLRELGGDPTLRAAEGKDGPVVTDNGNVVLDCDFGRIESPGDLAAALSEIPGVVAHGLFVDMADTVYVGREDGVDVLAP